MGNIDTPGGYCFPRTYRFNGTGISPFDLEKSQLNPQKFISLLKRRKLTPQMCFIYESNPAYTNPESGLTSEVLKDERLVPYIVVADSYMTETAALADIFLP